MKKVISSLVLLLIAATTFGQDLAGVWVGEVSSQIDNTSPYTLELEIRQQGDTLRGRSRIYDPYTTNYAVRSFIGEIDGDRVRIFEQGTISSRVLPDSYNRRWWRTKDLRGTLIVDEKNGKLRIKGHCSNAASAADHRGGAHNLMASTMRPGAFTLRKLTAEEVGEEGEER